MTNEDVSPASWVRWPHMTALLASGGHITIGHIPPIEGAAVAATADTVLATLVRRPNESVDELVQRLDYAIGQALHTGIRTNEIEGGSFVLARSEDTDP